MRGVREAQVPGASSTTSAGRASGTSSGPACPRSMAMKLTGHKTESVYRRYAILSDADFREAAQRVRSARPGAFRGTLGVRAR